MQKKKLKATLDKFAETNLRPARILGSYIYMRDAGNFTSDKLPNETLKRLLPK